MPPTGSDHAGKSGASFPARISAHHIVREDRNGLVGEDWTDMKTFVQRARGAEADLVTAPGSALVV
nr:hypothetical protein [Rhizobium leguminosarum]